MTNWRSLLVIGYVIFFVLAQSVATTEGKKPPRPPSDGTPDLVVESVAMSPANPLVGDEVTFSCKVLNTGNGPTPEGVVIGVAYFIDDVYETYGFVDGPLQAGDSVTVGTSSVAWSSTGGFHTLTALVDDVNRITESNETNNDYSTPPFTVFTEQANRFGMNIDPANPAGNPTAEELKTIGVRWVRIEWKADFGGFDYYDPIISAYRTAGLHVLLLVDYMSVPGKPPSDARSNVWKKYVSKFKSGVRDIANHYGDGVDAWEIWNEPDLLWPGNPYDPGVPAKYFGQMLKDAVEVIRPVSSRPIIVGGLASGDPNYLQQASDAVGGLTVDAVGVHPYGQRVPDNWPVPTWGFGNMSDLLDRYLVFGLPLWLTEIGTSDEAIQADYLENVFALTGGEYGWGVPVVLWFCWSDGMVPPMGVLFTDGTPKDSYSRYETIAPQW